MYHFGCFAFPAAVATFPSPPGYGETKFSAVYRGALWGRMFEESGFCDEVIITASGEAFREILGKEAVVLGGLREEDGIWYSAYVPGDRVWKVPARETVPTGRRVSSSIAM